MNKLWFEVTLCNNAFERQTAIIQVEADEAATPAEVLEAVRDKAKNSVPSMPYVRDCRYLGTEKTVVFIN